MKLEIGDNLGCAIMVLAVATIIIVLLIYK